MATPAFDPARQTALGILLRFEKGGANRLKADSLLADALSGQAGLSETDRAFAHALVMGTLRHWFRLGVWIETLSGRPLKHLEPKVRGLLRLGLFQLDGLSQVPPHAALNSTVELGKRQKLSPKAVKFVNAILREAQRQREAGGLQPPESNADFAGHLLWRYGWPDGWGTLLQTQYDADTILAMAEAAQNPPPLTIRVNTLKTTVADYQTQLRAAGIEAVQDDPGLPEALRIANLSGSPRQLPGYAEGLFYVQDPASMGISHQLAPQPGERVLDLCAAPGSKTTHMAALMRNQGVITAVEPKAERLKRLTENLQRLGVANVEPLQADGLDFKAEAALYDRILVDAPCSGSGTIRRHPEILLQLQRPDLKPYRKLQAALLARGYELLKPGGLLVYSTCSILKAENQDVVQDFLKTHPQARLDFERQRLITESGDGFYAAGLVKPDA